MGRRVIIFFDAENRVTDSGSTAVPVKFDSIGNLIGLLRK